MDGEEMIIAAVIILSWLFGFWAGKKRKTKWYPIEKMPSKAGVFLVIGEPYGDSDTEYGVAYKCPTTFGDNSVEKGYIHCKDLETQEYFCELPDPPKEMKTKNLWRGKM